MPRPKINGRYVDSVPECPVCGDPITWTYNHYGTLKGRDPETGEQHYPRCPNFTKSVMLPLSFAKYINSKDFG